MKLFLILTLVSVVFGQLPPGRFGEDDKVFLRQDLPGCLTFEDAIYYAKFFTKRDLSTFLMTQPIEEFGAYLEESFDNFCDQVKDADGSTGIACIDQCEDYGIGVATGIEGIVGNLEGLFGCDQDNDFKVTVEEAKKSNFCGHWKEEVDLLQYIPGFLDILSIRYFKCTVLLHNEGGPEDGC